MGADHGRAVASGVHRVHGGTTDHPQSEARWKYVVEYRVDGGKPQRVELEQEWGWLSKRMINVSGQLPLLPDRRSGKVRFDWTSTRR